MAARRVSKSAVDWAKLADLVPANQKDIFRAFKARSDMFISRVHRFPEALPAIEFSVYAARLSNPALVEQYQKAYAAISVPYPKDNTNLKAAIEAEAKAAQELLATETAEARKEIQTAKALLECIDSVPPLEKMTQEMYAEYFPEQALNPAARPSFWPHTKEAQTGFDPAHEVKA